MATLQYKTRSKKKSLNGLARIWFCAHPEDYDLYFESFSSMMLDTCDCVVWYDADPTGEYSAETLRNELAQVQLFVIPVTRKFLTSPCRAFDFELRLALESYIPILPILVESGLADIFNERVGSIQCLDRLSTDATALTFDAKLDKFLGAVLLDDSTAARVRASFAGYIFLSYRKIDRERANDIMRLVHSDERYRDVAIWYDEYLTPGENFNDEIRAALERCGLFMLLVTPNIVMPNDAGDDNYVVKEEYPLARKMGKTVVAAEVVSTARDELENKFENIPECIDPCSEGAIHNALKCVFHNSGVESSDSSEHDFLLGLAYLYGIDVEIDRARGLELIMAAANAGYPEAIGKIGDMYRFGEGVGVDMQKAIEYRYLLSMRYLELYNESGEEQMLEQLVNTLIVLSDDCMLVRDYGGAQRACERIIEACEVGKSLNIAEAKAIALVMLGNIYIYQLNYELAAECLDKAIEESVRINARGIMQRARTMRATLALLTGNPERVGEYLAEFTELDDDFDWDDFMKLYDDASANIVISNGLAACGEYRRAAEACTEVLDWLESVYSKIEPQIHETPLTIINIIEGLASGACALLSGAECNLRDGIDEALRYNQRWLERSRMLYEVYGLGGSEYNIAIYCTDLARLFRVKSEAQNAIIYIDEAIDILEKTSDLYIALDDLVLRWYAYFERACCFMEQHRLTEAARDSISAAYYSDMLPEQPHYQIEALAELCDSLADKLIAEKMYDVAVKVCDWAHISYFKLDERVGTPENKKKLADSIMKCADCRFNVGDYSGAEDFYGRALRVLEGLNFSLTSLQIVGCRRRLYQSRALNTCELIKELIREGDEFIAEGDIESAVESYYRAERMLNEYLAEKNGVEPDHQTVCDLYSGLARLEERRSDKEKAAYYTEKYKGARIVLLLKKASYYYREGKIRIDNGAESGVEYLEKAEKYYAELIYGLDYLWCEEEYAYVCYYLGMITGYVHSRRYLEKAFELFKALVEQGYGGKVAIRTLERIRIALSDSE